MARHALLVLLLLLSACAPGGGMKRLNDKTEAQLLGIIVTPEEVVVPMGGTVQLSATGLYDNRKTRDLTAVVTWKTADDRVASHLGLDGEGRFSAVSVGGTQITASLEGVRSPPTLLTVTDQTLTALSIEPGELVIEAGQVVELSATATFSDGSRSDATGLVRWITGDGSVASIDAGVLNANGSGTTTINAQYEDVVSNVVPVDVLIQASPDLRIATLSTNPYSDSATVIVEIENVGTAGASSFWVDAFLDFPGTPGVGDYGDAWERVSWIGPGDTQQVVFELEDLASGGWDLDVVVDTSDEVAELDEGNNHRDATFSITGGTVTLPTLPPDIAIDQVEWISDGTWVYYYVEISNYGDSGVGPFWVDVYVDQWSSPAIGSNGDDWAQVSWIGPWSTVAIEFLVEADCTWGCDSWVLADSLDAVSEPYESDNLEGPLWVY